MARARARALAGAIANGDDPNLVELICNDALNSISVVVARNTFVLRRARRRPLPCSL